MGGTVPRDFIERTAGLPAETSIGVVLPLASVHSICVLDGFEKLRHKIHALYLTPGAASATNHELFAEKKLVIRSSLF